LARLLHIEIAPSMHDLPFVGISKKICTTLVNAQINYTTLGKKSAQTNPNSMYENKTYKHKKKLKKQLKSARCILQEKSCKILRCLAQPYKT